MCISPETIGMIGEHAVKRLLNELPQQNYIVYNNVLFQTPYRSTQFDHIILSKYGVFIIETKNYKGQIYGNQYDEQWVEIISKQKFFFRNPIKQNYAHLKVLSVTYGLPQDVFIPIVVFSNKCTLHITASNSVINMRQLIPVILSYHTEKITENKLVAIYHLTNAANVQSSITSNLHVKRLKNGFSNIPPKIMNIPQNERKCPRCGGKLLERTGAFGKFLGCSNYPNCRHTEKLRKDKLF